MDAWRVLVVDDEPDVRASLAEVVRGIPDTAVEEAAGIAEAIPKLRAGRFDMVVTDERLQDGSGVDLLRWVGARDPVASLVLTSAHHDDAGLLLRAINDAHVHHFATKPWDPQELAARLGALLAEQRVLGHRMRAFAQAGQRAATGDPAAARPGPWPPS